MFVKLATLVLGYIGVAGIVLCSAALSICLAYYGFAVLLHRTLLPPTSRFWKTLAKRAAIGLVSFLVYFIGFILLGNLFHFG